MATGTHQGTEEGTGTGTEDIQPDHGGLMSRSTALQGKTGRRPGRTMNRTPRSATIVTTDAHSCATIVAQHV